MFLGCLVNWLYPGEASFIFASLVYYNEMDHCVINYTTVVKMRNLMGSSVRMYHQSLCSWGQIQLGLKKMFLFNFFFFGYA